MAEIIKLQHILNAGLSILRVVCTRAPLSSLKCVGSERDHSYASSFSVKNAWSFTSTLQTFIVTFSIKHTDELDLICIYRVTQKNGNF